MRFVHTKKYIDERLSDGTFKKDENGLIWFGAYQVFESKYLPPFLNDKLKNILK